MNWNEIKTPINADVLEALLDESNYDNVKAQYLVSGFRQGFNIGYKGLVNHRNEAHNLPFHTGNETDLWNKVMKEVEVRRYVGPFSKDNLSFEHFVQSPIGLIPKSNNKMRLIFHLSYDFGNEPENRSINHHTPAEECSVSYNDLDHAIKNCLKVLQNHSKDGPLVFGKTDCSNAFRVIPTLPVQRFLLVMKAQHPVKETVYYFIDKCLLFGSSKNCAIYQSFLDALRHITEFKTQLKLGFKPAILN